MRILLGSLVAAIAVVVLLNSSGAQSLQAVPDATGEARAPIVAELFTSQSCSSCPPAEKLFSTLSERADLIVLEWHVDYWDRLVHGRAGAWKDPYSDPAFTKRQRDYNRAIRGTGAVYTPQAVINGTEETVGSRRDDLAPLLQPAQHATANVSIQPHGNQLQINISEYVDDLSRGADIMRLILLPEQSTAVPRGENRGVTLSSKNIVLSASKVGTYHGDAQSLTIAAPKVGEACAIIIQQRRGTQLGPILGASYCS